MTWGLWGLDSTVSARTAMPYDFTAPAGEMQMPVERNEHGHVRVHRGIVVPRHELDNPDHFLHDYGVHWSTNEQISQALSDPAVNGENDDDVGLLLSGWYDPAHGTHSDPDPITGGHGYNEHEQEITMPPGTPIHVDRARWKHPDWNYDRWEDLGWSPGTHTASRTAMPWYHTSPHDLPDGTRLVPSGGGSAFGPEVYHDEWADHPNHVWMWNDPKKAVQFLPEVGAEEQPDGSWEYGHVYEVQPGAEPQGNPNTGFTAPHAHIIRKINPKEARTMTAAVTVYTKPDCPQCTMTKKQLDKLGVEHRVIDVTADPDAHAYVTGLGYQSAPVVVVNDGERHWAGFSPDKIKGLVSGE